MGFESWCSVLYNICYGFTYEARKGPACWGGWTFVVYIVLNWNYCTPSRLCCLLANCKIGIWRFSFHIMHSWHAHAMWSWLYDNANCTCKGLKEQLLSDLVYCSREKWFVRRLFLRFSRSYKYVFGRRFKIQNLGLFWNANILHLLLFS